MSKKKKPSPPLVTLIEDPYGINTVEISDAQNEQGELNLDQDLIEAFDEDDQNTLDKIAKALENHAEAPQVSEPDMDPEAELAAQIAEDQALEREIEKEQENQAEAEASPSMVRMDAEEIQSCMEALLFISDKPLSLERLRQLLGPEYEFSLFQDAIASLQLRYQAIYHGFELIEVSGGYQFRTKIGRAHLAQKLVRVQTQRLSSGGMESLAIIAYNQPVMKEDIDKIRGVDSSYFVRGLLEKKLIKISGRSELPGRPMLYTTTERFLELFGLKDLSSLPSLRELEQMIPTSQSGNSEDEDPRVRDMRRLVGEMKADKSSALHYNPKEDDKILKEIKDRVTSIPTSTPYLDELKAAELQANQPQPVGVEQQPEVPLPAQNEPGL